nr:MAG TPA: hypothetical protein [Caudoviricetes sp.]
MKVCRQNQITQAVRAVPDQAQDARKKPSLIKSRAEIPVARHSRCWISPM